MTNGQASQATKLRLVHHAELVQMDTVWTVWTNLKLVINKSSDQPYARCTNVKRLAWR